MQDARNGVVGLGARLVAALVGEHDGAVRGGAGARAGARSGPGPGAVVHGRRYFHDMPTIAELVTDDHGSHATDHLLDRLSVRSARIDRHGSEGRGNSDNSDRCGGAGGGGGARSGRCRGDLSRAT